MAPWSRWRGETPEHSLLKTNLAWAVRSALSNKPCVPFDVDLRVRVQATGLATYPDLTMVCGPMRVDAEDRNAAVNPTALFEVLSTSTAGYDRGEKFDHYATIPSLRAYILVDHTRVHLDCDTPSADGSWARRGYGLGQRVRIEAIDAEIAVDDVYVRWLELRAQLAAEAERLQGS
ncbi:MAG: Uma2 family endonuclease [Myxococcales bacterium]|nr:Uma2 family endonuclease [Myxococcales bacterium]